MANFWILKRPLVLGGPVGECNETTWIESCHMILARFVCFKQRVVSL